MDIPDLVFSVDFARLLLLFINIDLDEDVFQNLCLRCALPSAPAALAVASNIKGARFRYLAANAAGSGWASRPTGQGRIARGMAALSVLRRSGGGRERGRRA